MSNDKNVFDIPIIPKKLKKEPKKSLNDDYDNPIIDDKVVEEKVDLPDIESSDHELTSKEIPKVEEDIVSYPDESDSQPEPENNDTPVVESTDIAVDNSSDELVPFGDIEIDLPDFILDSKIDTNEEENVVEEANNDNKPVIDPVASDNESPVADTITEPIDIESPVTTETEDGKIVNMDTPAAPEPIETDVLAAEMPETLDTLDDGPVEVPVAADLSSNENNVANDSGVLEPTPTVEEIAPNQTGVIEESITSEAPVADAGQPEINSTENPITIQDEESQVEPNSLEEVSNNNQELDSTVPNPENIELPTTETANDVVTDQTSSIAAESSDQNIPNDPMANNIDDQTPDLVSLMSSEVQSSSPETTQVNSSQIADATSDQPINQSVPVEAYQANQLPENQEITPMSLNATVGVIPDTLDQNYGVIGDDCTSVMPIVDPNNNADNNTVNEEKPKKEKKKKEKMKKEKVKKEKPEKEKPEKQPKSEEDQGKSKIKKILIPVFTVNAIFIGTIAFIAYRLFGAVDPVKTLASRIREIGNEYNSIISNNELYKSITENKELAYSGKLSINENEKETVINLDGGFSKDTKKLSLTADITKSGEEDVKLTFVLLNGSAFIRLLEDSYYYRFPLENNGGLDDYINLIDLKPLLDTTSDVLLQNLSKDKLSSDVMRVDLIYKTKWVNNYTYTMNADKANQIIKAFLDSIKDESEKEFISNYIEPNLTSEAKIKFFVSLKGLEGIAVEYNQKQFKIVATGNSSYAIAYASYIINFKRVNDNIDVTINNKGDNTVTSLSINYTSEKKDSSALGSLNINYKGSNKTQTIKLENELKSVSSATLLSPTNFLNYSTEEAQEKFNEEYQKTLPYSKIIDGLKK